MICKIAFDNPNRHKLFAGDIISFWALTPFLSDPGAGLDSDYRTKSAGLDQRIHTPLVKYPCTRGENVDYPALKMLKIKVLRPIRQNWDFTAWCG